MSVKYTLIHHEPPHVLLALVPLIHGDGFTSRPFGNRRQPWADAIEDAVRGDVSCANGHIEVETCMPSDEVVVDFVEALESVFGFPTRLVDSEKFYENHPCRTSYGSTAF